MSTSRNRLLCALLSRRLQRTFVAGILVTVVVAVAVLWWLVDGNRLTFGTLQVLSNASVSPVPRARRFLHRDDAKLLLFVSYAGSGNTWIRHVIETGTGIFTGSAYGDHALLRDFGGENVADSTTICVKDHDPCNQCSKVNNVNATRHRNAPYFSRYFTRICAYCERIGYSSAIPPLPEDLARTACEAGLVLLLIRNPFDAILADFHWRYSGMNHTGFAQNSDLAGDLFVQYFEEGIQAWLIHTARYTRASLHTTYYEQLTKNSSAKLTELFVFLKQFRPDALGNLDPAEATRLALSDLRGNQVREKSSRSIDPYAVPRSNGTTLRQIGCEMLHHAGAWIPSLWGQCIIR